MGGRPLPTPPRGSRRPAAPAWGHFFAVADVSKGSRRPSPSPPQSRRSSLVSRLREQVSGYREQDTPCGLCEYVGEELDAFDYRRKHQVAVSVKGLVKIQPASTGVPSVVQTLFDAEQRYRTPLMTHLRALNPEQLRGAFRQKMKYNGCILKSRYMAMMYTVLDQRVIGDPKGLLALFDTLDIEHKGELDYCYFFYNLPNLIGGGDASALLRNSWQVMKKEKLLFGYVSRYEIETVLGYYVRQGGDPAKAAELRQLLLDSDRLPFNAAGECPFSHLYKYAEQHPILHDAFIADKESSFMTLLRKELSEEQEKRKVRQAEAYRRNPAMLELDLDLV